MDSSSYWDEIYKTGRQRPVRSIIKVYSNYFIGKVLDVGCGTFIPSYADWTGLESNKIAVEELKKKGANVIHGTIYDLPDGYDTISCMMVLEHLEHPEEAVDEMCRKAKKRIIIGGPNYLIYNKKRSMRNILAYILYWLTLSDDLKPTNPKTEKDEHYNVNEVWLRRRLKKNGWKVYSSLKPKVPFPPLNMMGRRLLLVAEPFSNKNNPRL